MAYTVVLTNPVVRQLKKLPRKAQVKISQAIDSLSKNPRPQGAIKLQGKKTYHRLRVGDYRIIYHIHDKKLVVAVLRVAHRKEVYR